MHQHTLHIPSQIILPQFCKHDLHFTNKQQNILAPMFIYLFIYLFVFKCYF